MTQPLQDRYGEAGRCAQEGGGQSSWRGRLRWHLRESPDALAVLSLRGMRWIGQEDADAFDDNGPPWHAFVMAAVQEGGCLSAAGRARPAASGWTVPSAGAASCRRQACAGSGSHHGVAGSGRDNCCARQLGIDRARQGVQGLVGTPDSLAAQSTSRYRPARCCKPAGGYACLADAGRDCCRRPGVVVLLRGCPGPSGRTGPGQRRRGCGLVPGRPCLVLGGPGRGPRYCWSSGPMVRCVRCGAGIGAQHVGQRGPHGQDQDRQAGHDRGDGPRRTRRPGLGQQVVGDLPGHAEREGADRGPLGEPAGPAADRRARRPARRAARTPRTPRRRRAG